ncbi:MAG: flagellar basal body rod protein FlgB [Lachnospiraceae bacterium]|nr:flagellar basal body rod protein FlgB [Lachnospiraceae bacterium]
MINSNVFDYVNVLQKAADASWQRHEVLSNNIANVNTPGYKRRDIDFESQLRQALGESRYESVDSKVAHLSSKDLRPRIFTDASNFSYRMDKNNVDIDTESVELASNQLKYDGLGTSIQHEFQMLQSVMRSSGT